MVRHPLEFISMIFRFGVMLGFLGSVSGCSPHPNKSDSNLAIVGGRPVSKGEAGPAVGLILRYKEPSVIGFVSKTCSGVRVSSSQIMTAASCFGTTVTSEYQLAILVAGDGTRASGLEVLDVVKHPDFIGSDVDAFNVALITLKEFPNSLDKLVTQVRITEKGVSEGEAVQVFGAGCEKLKDSGVCDGPYSILRYLKTFTSQVKNFASDPINRTFFDVNEEAGSSVDGDIGGPVLDAGQQELLGLAAYRSDELGLGNMTTHYLNLARPELLTFLNQNIMETAEISEAFFDVVPVENDHGGFYEVGSFITFEDKSSVKDEGFGLQFSLNGKSLSEDLISRNGSRYTITKPLQEGSNEITIVLTDFAGNILHEDRKVVMAGSRVVRVKLPESMAAMSSSIFATISIHDGRHHRGRGIVKGDEVVFVNIPKISAIISIDSLTGQTLREFLEPNLDVLQPVLRSVEISEPINLDWQKGLESWSLFGDSSAASVLSGRQIKNRPIAVASGPSLSPSPVGRTLSRRNSAIRAANDAFRNYSIEDGTQYLVLSAQPQREVEFRKKFRPLPGNPVLVLRSLFRVRGADFLDVKARESVGAFTVKIISGDGKIIERTSELNFQNLVSDRYLTTFQDLVLFTPAQLDGSQAPVEVVVKLKVYSHDLGIPEVIVAPIILTDHYFLDLEFDDGNATLSPVPVTKFGNKKKVYNLSNPVSKLEMLSMGSCQSKCLKSNLLKNDLVVWGKMRFFGQPGIKVEDMKLELYDSQGMLGEGEVFDDETRATYLTALPLEGFVRGSKRLPLFRYSTAILPSSLNAEGRVQLGVRVTLSNGRVVRAPFDERLKVLQWYPGTSISPTKPGELALGGDKWSISEIGDLISPLMSKFTANDFSNLHGGPFAPHKSHMYGRDVDLTHKAGINTNDTVDDVLDVLSDASFLSRIDQIGITVKLKSNWRVDSAVYQKTKLVIDRLIELEGKKTKDGRYISPFTYNESTGEYVLGRRSSIFTNWDGHFDHIHLRFIDRG